jgi:hypothetical protein
MELWQKIIEVYPELADNDYEAFIEQIILQDDSDGVGAYIKEWNYSQPIPDGLILGKPSA